MKQSIIITGKNIELNVARAFEIIPAEDQQHGKTFLVAHKSTEDRMLKSKKVASIIKVLLITSCETVQQIEKYYEWIKILQKRTDLRLIIICDIRQKDLLQLNQIILKFFKIIHVNHIPTGLRR